jgi:hypothetical protein
MAQTGLNSYGQIWALFVSGFFSFWPPKAVAAGQKSSFLARFYENHFSQNRLKST